VGPGHSPFEPSAQTTSMRTSRPHLYQADQCDGTGARHRAGDTSTHIVRKDLLAPL
jgi:hypothetical protein